VDGYVNSRKSAALQQYSLGKHKTYAPLVSMAKKQTETGHRPINPLFIPAVCGTHGEVGEGFVTIQEWLCKRYLLRQSLLGEQDDGIRLNERTAVFRAALKTRIQVAIANGVAQMLLAAGLPRGSCRKFLAA
jgi:hypothetical protein